MNKLRQNIQPFIFYTLAAFLIFFSCLGISFAQEGDSVSFKLLTPTVTSGGGYSFSSSFKLDSSISQIGIGTSSAADFNANGGFLYFPYITTPIVSVSAGDGQANLSWTPADGVLGWTAAGYDVGVSIVSGGPYNFSASLGNVLSSMRSGLSNGATYYFVIGVLDSYGNTIATSSEVSATPAAPSPPPSPGGGGSITPVATTAIFSGRAYPKSSVTLLKDAQVVATTIAGTDANFSISLSNLTGGNYIFSVYSEDNNGIRSSLLTFPVSITSGATTNVSGIFIAPTIAVDKSEVKKGDNLAIFGQTTPSANITITVNSDQELYEQTASDKNGVYLYNLDTTPLDMGQHSTKSKSAVDGAISSFSQAVAFAVGTKNVLAESAPKCPTKGDLNGDCKVNLVDFSIASYWYKKPLSDALKKIEITELNGDGVVNLVDFSIMAYYWTG